MEQSRGASYVRLTARPIVLNDARWTLRMRFQVNILGQRVLG
jgi:hypothetical protein